MRRTGRPAQSPSRFRYDIVLRLFVAVSLLWIGGCADKTEPITSYTVKKHKLIQVPLEQNQSSSASSSEQPEIPVGPMTLKEPTDRILGAILLLDDLAWFVKGTGPVDEWPEDTKEEFDKLLTTFKFEDLENPTWELSDRWKENPPSNKMRHADLAFDGITFSVSRLGRTPGSDRTYLVQNVNRWRGQLGLGGVDSKQLAGASHKIKTADGKSMTVVDYVGKKGNSGMPPMMGNGQMGGGPMRGGPMQGPMAGGPGSAAKPPPAGPGFSAEPPESWEETEPGSMRKAKYVVTSGEETGVASVARAGGDVIGNVNRWRGQVNLPAIETPEEVNAEKISVSGNDGLLLRLIGEEKGIVVAMVPPLKPGFIWFFKLEGPKKLVEEEADSFLKYLETVKFD